jgi:hypothetical protein
VTNSFKISNIKQAKCVCIDSTYDLEQKQREGRAWRSEWQSPLGLKTAGETTAGLVPFPSRVGILLLGICPYCDCPTGPNVLKADFIALRNFTARHTDSRGVRCLLTVIIGAVTRHETGQFSTRLSENY